MKKEINVVDEDNALIASFVGEIDEGAIVMNGYRVLVSEAEEE